MTTTIIIIIIIITIIVVIWIFKTYLKPLSKYVSMCIIKVMKIYNKLKKNVFFLFFSNFLIRYIYIYIKASFIII